MIAYREWSQIHSIRELFVTTNTTLRESTIYGNGRNQTEIIVHMVALDDKKNEIVGIPSSDFFNHTNLIDYITGEAVLIQDIANSDNKWSFSLHSNGFNFAPLLNNLDNDIHASSPEIHTEQVEKSNISPPEISDNEFVDANGSYLHTESPVYPSMGAILSFYVMRGPHAGSRSKQFAAKVRLTNSHAPVQIYSTGFNGTPEFNSYITVKALDPIDYSYSENRIVTKTPAEIMSRSISYQKRSEDRELGWVYTTHGGQVSQRSTIVISPAIGGTFRTVEDLSNLEINDNYVNQGGMEWQDSETPGFTGINIEHPISVLGRTTGFSNSFFINYWYLSPQNAQFYGHCLLDNNRDFNQEFYQFYTNFDESRVHEVPNPGRIVCWQFELRLIGLRNIFWRTVERENLRLRLTDRYGNQGVISLVFDLNAYFNEPRIV